MEVSFVVDNALLKLLNPVDFDNKIQKSLVQASLIIQNQAKINAPYQRGTLRRSITTDTSMIRSWKVVIGSPVVYATVREFVNFKNPSRKYYFSRAYQSSEARIRQIFIDNFNKQ